MSKPKIINIDCKKVFIETDLSINVTNKLLHKLVRQYDMNLKQYEIYLEGEQPEALKTKYKYLLTPFESNRDLNGVSFFIDNILYGIILNVRNSKINYLLGVIILGNPQK